MTYAQALRTLLAKSGLSQADLAKGINRSRSYISQLLNGKVKDPSINTAYAISKVLGVQLQDFIDLMHETHV
ncbi:MAG: helix-turn-helix transcriptional regulator [Atopobium minutum]|nr:helix-turn-helix transcriptional regulator [Atopobium minutum]